MDFGLLASMSGFALVASITPGPVNLVALASGLQFGFRAAMWHVSGATLGFVVLLLVTGLGFNEVVGRWPELGHVAKWSGVLFLLYMAVRLVRDDGAMSSGSEPKRPSLLAGAIMQWLNPKAWLASMAGVGLYCAHGDTAALWVFAGIYFVICYLSVATWAGAGQYLRRFLNDPRRVRLLNRVMAVLIAASVVYLL